MLQGFRPGVELTFVNFKPQLYDLTQYGKVGVSFFHAIGRVRVSKLFEAKSYMTCTWTIFTKLYTYVNQ